MVTNSAYVIGVDYGSDSVRTIIVGMHRMEQNWRPRYFIIPAGRSNCIAMLWRTSFASIRWIM